MIDAETKTVLTSVLRILRETIDTSHRAFELASVTLQTFEAMTPEEFQKFESKKRFLKSRGKFQKLEESRTAQLERLDSILQKLREV